MKKNIASKVIRWIGRLLSIFVSGTILLIFFSYLIGDLINMATGAPLNPDGFFQEEVGLESYVGFLFIGLAITGHIFLWFSERRGIVLTFIGGLLFFVYYIIIILIVSGNFPVVIFRTNIFLILPALLILLARWLERSRQNPDPVIDKPVE